MALVRHGGQSAPVDLRWGPSFRTLHPGALFNGKSVILTNLGLPKQYRLMPGVMLRASHSRAIAICIATKLPAYTIVIIAPLARPSVARLSPISGCQSIVAAYGNASHPICVHAVLALMSQLFWQRLRSLATSNPAICNMHESMSCLGIKSEQYYKDESLQHMPTSICA